MDDSRPSEADQTMDERVLTQQVLLMSVLTTSPLFATMLVGAMLAWLDLWQITVLSRVWAGMHC